MTTYASSKAPMPDPDAYSKGVAMRIIGAIYKASVTFADNNIPLCSVTIGAEEYSHLAEYVNVVARVPVKTDSRHCNGASASYRMETLFVEGCMGPIIVHAEST